MGARDPDDPDARDARGRVAIRGPRLKGEAQTQLDGDAVTEAEADRCFTRGLNPRAAMAWVKATHGDAGVRAVLDAIDADDARALGLPERIALTAWVPFLAHARLLSSIDQLFGVGDLSSLRAVGHYMGWHDFPVIARPAIRLVTPGFFIDKAMKLWRMYHSHGWWEIWHSDDEVRAVLTDHPEHHVAFCATFRGWIEGALALTGAVGPEASEVRCAARGAPVCSFHAVWSSSRGSARTRTPRAPN